MEEYETATSHRRDTIIITRSMLISTHDLTDNRQMTLEHGQQF